MIRSSDRLPQYAVAVAAQRVCYSGHVIRSYLSGQSLKLLDILLDPSSSLLFYNLHFFHQIPYNVIDIDM